MNWSSLTIYTLNILQYLLIEGIWFQIFKEILMERWLNDWCAFFLSTYHDFLCRNNGFCILKTCSWQLIFKISKTNTLFEGTSVGRLLLLKEGFLLEVESFNLEFVLKWNILKDVFKKNYFPLPLCFFVTRLLSKDSFFLWWLFIFPISYWWEFT